MPYADVYVKTLKDVPAADHYAIFRQDSHYTPGDERSRTNPGHGYPASTDYFLSYEAYLTSDSFLAAINAAHKDVDKIRIAKISPLKIKVETKVEVK